MKKKRKSVSYANGDISLFFRFHNIFNFSLIPLVDTVRFSFLNTIDPESKK